MNNEISEEDIADFRKHVEFGNLSDAKMILYRVSIARTPSEAAQVVPLDKAKTDFLKYWEFGNLKFCASIFAKHKNLITQNSEEIEKIMKENKKNNELNFTEHHYQEEQKHQVSGPESEHGDFEFVKAHEASNGNHEASKSESKLDDSELVEDEIKSEPEEDFVMVESAGTLDDPNVSQVNNGIKR